MSNQWYVARSNKKQGPFTDAKLKELAEQGQLQPTDMILQQGMIKWIPAGSVKELFLADAPSPFRLNKNVIASVVGGIMLVVLGVILITKQFGISPVNRSASIEKGVGNRIEEGNPPKNFTNNIGMKFVWIPPGSFLMGSPKKEIGRDKGETQHQVTLTKGFYMGVFTVTQGQWEAVMGNNPSFYKGEKHLPVEMVSWEDCQVFLKKMSKKEGQAYRLPTEAEWEYACRAGTNGAFCFGDDRTLLDQYAWSFETFGDKPHPVGQKKPNEWGLYDMHGNVWQWCQDRYGAYPQNPATDPLGPESGATRVMRGGSCTNRPSSLRSANRIDIEPTSKAVTIGFRVAKTFNP
jgi:formylglycine-generating enzyme required for sulfatase activity